MLFDDEPQQIYLIKAQYKVIKLIIQKHLFVSQTQLLILKCKALGHFRLCCVIVLIVFRAKFGLLRVHLEPNY